MTWIRIRIRIHFFERRIQDPDPDPDPHQNVMDPKHWFWPLNLDPGSQNVADTTDPNPNHWSILSDAQIND